MGLCVSSPSSEYRAAGFMLPSVVDTRPPHYAVRPRPAGQSKTRGAPWEASTALLPASLIPRPGDGTSENRNGPAGQSCSNPMCFIVLLCGGWRLLAPAELGAVDPHAMEHAPELACQRDLRPLQAAALGNLHRPALEDGEARRPAQYRIG